MPCAQCTASAVLPTPGVPVRPDVGHDLGAGQRLATGEGEQRQQRTLAGPAEIERLPVTSGPYRAEHEDA
jgi:hypothetical protein